MLGPLDAVVAHLALDDPRGDAQPPEGQQLGADLADRGHEGGGERLGAVPCWVRTLRRAARSERVKETRSGSTPASSPAARMRARIA